MPEAADLRHFQREKLEYYFNFYEPNKQGCLDASSLDRFMQRVLKFTGWDPNSAKTQHCREVHEAFFEILLEQPTDDGQRKTQVSLDEWLAMWARLLPGCMGMRNFPVWLRLLPRILHEMMDRNGEGVVDEANLKAFYKDMMMMPASEVEARAHVAYDQMTDGGRWPLTADSYEMIFANFLIGKTPYGPGRHIFGCFEHSLAHFELILPAADSDEDEDVEMVTGGARSVVRKPKAVRSV